MEITINDKEEIQILVALNSMNRQRHDSIRIFNKNTEFDKKMRKTSRADIKLNNKIIKKINKAWKMETIHAIKEVKK